MTIDLLLWSIPALILAVAMLGIRRYSLLNVGRHLTGVAIVFGTLAISASVLLEPAALIILGAIGGTLVGQAYEAEKQRAALRRDDAMIAATRS